ncbi:MAG: hypothetical protein M3350_08780 [Actinomycetota bacterium]|nr:hypothetical protein [Actinomycetota bacterium]
MTTLGIVLLVALALIAVAALAALYFERRAGIERRKAAEAEREWSRELRGQLVHLQRENSVLAD